MVDVEVDVSVVVASETVVWCGVHVPASGWHIRMSSAEGVMLSFAGVSERVAYGREMSENDIVAQR